MSQITTYGSGNPLPGIVVETLTGNTGGAVSPDGVGNINVVGDTGITTVGNLSANTLTIRLENALDLTAVTVDDVPLEVTSLTIAEGEAYLFTVQFMGAIDDYSESLGGQKWATAARMVAGATNLSDTNGLTSKTIGVPDETDFSFGLSGNAVTFLVTGEAATTYNWKLRISWVVVDV